jgi:hypothetical protein
VITEDKPAAVRAYGLSVFDAKVGKTEEFGGFFNPILATMITSGARLMLAMAEAWLEQHGGYYAFCDTDSMAVSPFYWKPLQTFFQSLNPYDSSDPILKLEHDERNEERQPPDLWFYGISAKRYVLHRIVNGRPVIVGEGWSSHGLGHLLHTSREDDGTRGQWEKELWLNILKQAYSQMTEGEICELYSGEYAISRYAVTKPNLHRRLKAINCSKDSCKQVKPYNFILIGQPAEIGVNGQPVHPVTKFTSHVAEAPFQPFIDYNTGKRHPGGSQLYWKQLPETIRDYLNHPESKFSNGERTGKMKRQHLPLDDAQISYIGKEADEIEETETLGGAKESYVEYLEKN